MEFKIHTIKGKEITEIFSKYVLIKSTQDILDLMVNVPSNIIVLNKNLVSETFFDLKTGLAGEILQKLTNYSIKLGLVGDYSKYTSKSLKDFIYECNKGNHFVFVDTVNEAMKKLSK